MELINVTSFILALVIAPLVYIAYVIVFMRWQKSNTIGDRYFSRTLAGRRALKQWIKWQSQLVLPLFRLLAFLSPLKTPPLFSYQGVTGPKAMASKQSFQEASEFTAGEDDIFIATQMKCGTTWMQQIVFEILHKGEGDLSDTAYRHMYALSPWLETNPNGSVSIDKAPKVSEYKKRLVKTHMPTKLCPYSKLAKYIYVTRHPVSCYASVVDFIELLMGPMAPKREDLLSWFCSEKFYWLSWAKHVEGWWQWSQQYDNVMFVHFERLKAEPGIVIDQIAEFLDVTLTVQQREKVINKTSFNYMKDMEEYFEMAAPSIFSMSSSTNFMHSGKQKRHQDVSEQDRLRINRYMAEQLHNAEYPLKQFYPDVIPDSDNARASSS